MANPELEHGRFSELPEEDLTEEEKERLERATDKKRREQGEEARKEVEKALQDGIANEEQ